VNIASAWLLSGGGEGHSHGHGHAHEEHEHDESKPVTTSAGTLTLDIFEDGVPPRFRLYADTAPLPDAAAVSIETVRPDGTTQFFTMEAKGLFLESGAEIPEPHEFTARVNIGAEKTSVVFEEHQHAETKTGRDNNMRAAVVHVIADAAVSVLVIIGLVLAKFFGWLWMDPLAGIIGAFVIANWALGLIRDTGGILLDMNPDRAMAEKLRSAIEADGDTLADLHLWRLGPGHLGAILCVGTDKPRNTEYYRAKLARFRTLSHLTVEVRQG
jgi:cation diffusion facilitator family transporter